MTDEPDNLPEEGGTDNVDTSQDDTSSEWDLLDPDEYQDDEEIAADDETDDDGDPDDGGTPEGEEAAEEPADAPEDQPEVTETAKVRLADGTETTVGELIKERMMKADYTRKTQEVATRRKALEAEVSQLEQITNTFVDHLAQLLPAEPDTALIYSDPTRYTQQKAIYEQSVAQIQRLVDLGKQPKQIKDRMGDEDRRTLLAEENQRLVSMFPETGTQDGRRKFFGEVQATANELGFSDEELSANTDHRLFALAHWARKGMAAEKAKASAKAKLEKAPKSSPRKPGQANGQASNAKRQKARQALMRDDSIENAVRLLSS